MRKVFLENLPHGKKSEKGIRRKNSKNNGINWIDSVGQTIHFIFDEIEGDFKILKYEKTKGGILTIEYNNKEYKVNTINLKNSQIQTILFNRNEYKYKVGEIIGTKTGNKIKILEQIRLPNLKKYTQKGYEYECLNCGNIDTIPENTLYNKKVGCNVCCPNPTKVLIGYNDIATTDEWMIEWLADKEDAYKYTANSNKSIWFKCKDCGTKKKFQLCNFNIDYFPCPKCGDSYSYPNKFAFNLLEQLSMDFTNEYSPEWIGKKRYDFYFELNNKQYILEMDGGIGHGNRDNNMSGQTKEESKKIDEYKDEMAKQHGIKVIRIDCNYDTLGNRLEYIKQNILDNEKLNELFDLENIDWNKIEEYALSSLVKQVSDLWNSGLSIDEIADIVKMSISTVRKYLIKANELNWSTYTYHKRTKKKKNNIIL
jgi:AraC-like DNA-binding protein